MKKIIGFLVLFMLVIGTLNAQFSMLVEGGANYGKAKILKTDLIEHDNILGYFVGLTPQYQVTSLVDLGIELQYSVEGYAFDVDDQSSANQVGLHYIRIIPEIEFNILGPVSVIGGFNYGFLGIEKLRDSNGNSTNYGRDVRLSKSSDLGILAGLNLNLSGLNFSVKYNYGLKDINNNIYTDSNGNEIADFRVTNRFLQVGVGYLFGYGD